MLVIAEAEDGIEALSLIKEHLPDVVMLDLRMPHMDGLEVLGQVNEPSLRIGAQHATSGVARSP